MKSGWLLLMLASWGSGCACGNKVPPLESAPADLKDTGLVIDQALDGATVKGAWLTVSGWAAPELVQLLSLTGAPTDGFYVASGHVGVPSVQMTLRPDGRFFAPRVPLQDGANDLVLTPIAKGGASFVARTFHVTASETDSVPAVVVVAPAQPAPGEEATLRATTGADLSTSFQWDFDGDGTFEAEGAEVKHTWPEAGVFLVVARVEREGTWVSAATRVVVGAMPAAKATVSVPGASRVFAFPPGSFHQAEWEAELDGGTLDQPAMVAVIAGDSVQLFDADLQPRFTLSGLSQPSAITQDHLGNLYVADTGHDRIVRFTKTGMLDPGFGTDGAWKAADFKAPVSISFEASQVLLDDGSIWTCDPQPFGCTSSERNESLTARLADAALSRVQRLLVETAPRSLESWLVDGKVVSESSLRARKTKGAVLDATFGPSAYRGDLATVEEGGVLRVYLAAEPVVTWPLSNVRAVSADQDGRLYVVAGEVVTLFDARVLR